MRPWFFIVNLWWFALLIGFSAKSALPSPESGLPAPRVFAARGVVRELRPAERVVVIQHEAIAGFMAAMTMPFTVKETGEFSELQRGDVVAFQLHVTPTESWVDHLARTGTVTLPAETNAAAAPDWRNELLHYPFTNELGQAVRLSDFPGQALAITFFYTRCPLPEFCPRLSRNFQMASQQLESLPGAPPNWHLLSVSFDPEFDSPALLRAYGQGYHYDPAHWSFLTGPADEIHKLAQAAGVTVTADGSVLNHNFRTLIIVASGRLQTVFPTSGDLSDQIAAELLKAAKVTNRNAAASQSNKM
jgi:protein SCO1/2